MGAIGAKYKWQEGKILHASRLWKSPTKRRIPRMLIEDRAQEVAIKLYIKEPWLVFEETTIAAQELSIHDAKELAFYFNRYYLLPQTFENSDTYSYLQKKPLLLWGVGKKYFVKAI